MPTFPELFRNLIGSPPIKRIEDEITHPGQFRIQKQDWRPRSMYETELGAENVIYMLIDEKAKLLYVGEADNLIRRFKAGHLEIKDWDFYRYDQLPPMPKRQRVSIERMMIRVFASVLENKAGITTKSISEYRLANRRIDAGLVANGIGARPLASRTMKQASIVLDRPWRRKAAGGGHGRFYHGEDAKDGGQRQNAPSATADSAWGPFMGCRPCEAPSAASPTRLNSARHAVNRRPTLTLVGIWRKPFEREAILRKQTGSRLDADEMALFTARDQLRYPDH
jgi:hypothetical protein